MSTGSPSRSPSGDMYAFMWKRSTMPLSSCSWPIGICTATQRSDSWLRSCSNAAKKSARSRSSMFTNTTLERPSCSQRSQRRDVCTSTPATPFTTMSAPSTTRSAASVSAWKPGSPGVSMRLIFRSCHSRWQRAADRDICRRCSSSSQSVTVEACSTEPRRFVAPAWKSSASTSDVFPVPRWPMTATLRILPGSSAGMDAESSGLVWGLIGLRAGHGGRQSRLQAQNRFGVELRDAGLRHAQHFADLAQGQLLVVVEGDDQLFALRQARDRVAERLPQLRLRHRLLGLGRLLVGDRVDHRDRVTAGAGARPELIEGGDRGA